MNTGLVGGFHAIEESEPFWGVVTIIQRNVVVFDGARFPHVANTFIHTVLTGESPSSIGSLFFVGIAIRPDHEVHDFANGRKSRSNLSCGVRFTSWAV